MLQHTRLARYLYKRERQRKTPYRDKLLAVMPHAVAGKLYASGAQRFADANCTDSPERITLFGAASRPNFYPPSAGKKYERCSFPDLNAAAGKALRGGVPACASTEAMQGSRSAIGGGFAGMIGRFHWDIAQQGAAAYAFKLTAAALGALVLAQSLKVALPLWSVLTALIVTQISLGRSLRVTLDYFAATLGGVLWGGAVAVLCLTEAKPLCSWCFFSRWRRSPSPPPLSSI